MKKYKELILALEFFEEDWLISTDYNACSNSLIRFLDSGGIDKLILRKDFELALARSDTDWRQIAFEARLFSNAEGYSRQEIKNIVELYLFELLFQKNLMEKKELLEVEDLIVELLGTDDGWVDVDRLLSMIQETHTKIRAYHLYNFTKYFSLAVLMKKENKLWVVDKLKLADSVTHLNGRDQ